MNTEVEIEPPGLDLDEDDDGDPYTYVHVVIFEMDGTRRAGYGGVPGDATDETMAAALVDALYAVAASRGPGLTAALEQRLERNR